MPTLEAEQRKIMEKHAGNIDFDILAEMDELHFAIKEALRMHPLSSCSFVSATCLSR